LIIFAFGAEAYVLKRVPIDELLKIKEQQDFERAWKYGGELLNDSSTYNMSRIIPTGMRGKSHKVNDLIENLRQRLLEMGFDEVINEAIFPAEDVMKQWGPTGYAILDRCYYLAALPRPDVGLSAKKQDKIRSLGIELPEDKVLELQETLHKLKTGELKADELVAEIARVLGVDDPRAIEVFEKILPEFKKLKPLPSNLTLRSHMTSAWFETLSALQRYRSLPVKLFSIGPRFRREQREDATHLRVHNSASCVVMDEDVSVDVGKWITEELLKPFGFEEFKFDRIETGTDTYYAPGKHYEAYAYHSDFDLGTSENNGWLEVSDFGLYSPVALANYGIEVPVLNCGPGVERIAMIVYNYEDIRELVYPQFYEKFTLTDEELCNLISIRLMPHTEQGKELQSAIVEVCKIHGNDPSPAEFIAWEGEIFSKFIRVSVVEPEENTKLCGPAFLNEVFVKDGSIIGATKSDGITTGITYIAAFAAEAAYEIERALKAGKRELEVRVRISRGPNDINIRIDPIAKRYITSKNKKIDLRGPVFTTVRMIIEE
jgi:O-phosphoseryl-tRNA synthetase